MAIGALVALTATAAVFPNATAASAEPAPSAAAVGEAISWTPCGDELECARVPVPLDWDRPGKRAIELSVIRHLASRPDQRIGSMFVAHLE